jgi:hypothetical protein
MGKFDIASALSSGLSGAGQFLNSLFNSRQQRKLQRQEFRDAKEMAKYAFNQDIDMWNRQAAFNKEMWHMQNTFNLPENQMKRLREAGLNPNLVATSGASGGSAGSVATPSQAKYQQVRPSYDHRQISLPNVVGLYQSVAKTKADTDLIKEKVSTEATERALKSANLVGKGYANQMAKDLAKYSQQIAKFKMKNEASRFFESQARQNNLSRDFDIKTLEREKRKMDLDLYRDTGIRPQDRIEYRLFMRIFEKLFDGRIPF